MKKLLLVLLILVATPLMAASEVSDILLSSTGTLYTIASEPAAADSGTDASTYLVLTERTGETTIREIVPASKMRGSHFNGLLGYDADSGTLFVFWIQHFGYLYNQLLLTTRDRDGQWSEATSFGSPYNYRANLRLAVTQKVADPEGGPATPGLTVHATWWEFDTRTGREAAQYRMLPVVEGRVVDPSDVNLDEFLAFNNDASSPDADPSLLKQPLLSSSAKQDSVILVFANARSGGFSQVRFTPTRGMASEGRIRIPVGKRETGYRAPSLKIEEGNRLEGVFGGDHGRPVFYTVENDAVRYVALGENREWSPVRTIALDEQISAPAAVTALKRMVREQ